MFAQIYNQLLNLFIFYMLIFYIKNKYFSKGKKGFKCLKIR